MKQFLTVLRFELNNYFKNKSFVVTTVILALIVAGVIIVPTMIPGLLGDKKTEESEESLTELGICVNTDEMENVEKLLEKIPAKWTKYEEKESLKKDVEDGII